jgi:pyridoxine 4-dehydrogenase
LSRGFLTGDLKKYEDLPEDDARRHFPRFQPGNFEKNLELLSHVEKLAARKSCTPGQIAISWVKTQSKRKGLPEIIPIPGTTTEKRLAENMVDVELNESDMDELDQAVEKCVVHGGRYHGAGASLEFGDSPEL